MKEEIARLLAQRIPQEMSSVNAIAVRGRYWKVSLLHRPTGRMLTIYRSDDWESIKLAWRLLEESAPVSV